VGGWGNLFISSQPPPPLSLSLSFAKITSCSYLGSRGRSVAEQKKVNEKNKEILGLFPSSAPTFFIRLKKAAWIKSLSDSSDRSLQLHHECCMSDGLSSLSKLKNIDQIFLFYIRIVWQSRNVNEKRPSNVLLNAKRNRRVKTLHIFNREPLLKGKARYSWPPQQ